MSELSILVTGSTGLLGPYLMDAARNLGRVYGAARKNAEVELDVIDRKAVIETMKKLHPDVLIHAAAMTDVDACERNPKLAYLLNRDAVSFLAEALSPTSWMVYISTDQVYPDKSGPHVEGSEDPVNVYGKSKLAGESSALEHPRALVIRTNIFGPSQAPERYSLSDFVIDSLTEGKAITLFEDIYFSPLHMVTACRLLVMCLERELTGVFNLGSRNGMSKKDFALAVASHKGLSVGSASTGASSEMPDKAPRPKDMRVDVSRIEKVLGTRMPTLREEIKRL